MLAKILLLGAVGVTIALSDLRFLRVVQREHYIPGRALWSARLWTVGRPMNAVLLLVALVATVAAAVWSPLCGLGIVALAVWPWGLGVRGRTSRLAWTGRLKRLALVTVVLQLCLVLGLAATPMAALPALLALPTLELATWVMGKLEKRMGRKYVGQAQQRLAQVDPTVVAITGSYGKTSTKGYAAHVLSGAHSVVASPASFNNLLGLSRAVNDRLVPGTEVFVAEMGTYGPGEIRELCREFSPDVAAITTIGEAHLERMKDRATIVAAKSEIVEAPGRIVLNVDVPELAELAARETANKRVVRVSATAGADADVVVHPADDGQWHVVIGGAPVTSVAAPFAGHPINLAVAIGIAEVLDVDRARWQDRLGSLPGSPHRAEAAAGPNGVWLIDDTYNSNPVGAAAAIEAALSRAGEHRVFVVTPGMVELGDQQFTRNAELGRLATSRPTMQLAVVGSTNRRALTSGSVAAQTRLYANRDAAVAAVTAAAQPGDVILYENDLPDHYA